MNMVQNHICVTSDLDDGLQRVRFGRLFASEDRAAHRVSIAVRQGGRPASLDGLEIRACFIRPDRGTVRFTGTASGGTAEIVLPDACYAKPGAFSLVVRAVGADAATAILWAEGCVTESATDTIVDAEHIVPSLEALLATLDGLRTAAQSAEAGARAAESAAEAAGRASAQAQETAMDAGAAAQRADEAADAARSAAGMITDAVVPALAVGEVRTLPAGAQATASIDAADPRNPVLNLGLPRGLNGEGAVSAVEGVQPDAAGNVALPSAAAGRRGLVSVGAGLEMDGDALCVRLKQMTGATSGENGEGGLVPAPPAGAQDRFLRGDGTWQAVSDGGGSAGIDEIWPIGSIYLTVENVDPGLLFGGTAWRRIEDRFLLAAGTTYAAGSTGGEAAHTLTIAEMPNHRHAMDTGGKTVSKGSSYNRPMSLETTTDEGEYRTSCQGGGQPHNNMPPYLAVFVWQRVA